MDNQQKPSVQYMELCSMLSASLDGKMVSGRMDTCICMAESLPCSPETTTTLLIGYASIVVQTLSCVRLFGTPWTTAFQASLSITNSQSLLKLRSIESVMPSNHPILCHPFSSCLQSFPASGSFPKSQFFPWRPKY